MRAAGRSMTERRAEFEAAAAVVPSSSPLKQLFLRVADGDPALSELDLAGDQELIRWPVRRQAAALALLCGSPTIERVNLSGLGLPDDVAPVLAAAIRVGSALRILNLERNDLREPGLLAIVAALEANESLRELRLTGQRMAVSTNVEVALAELLDSGRGATALVKLGLPLRNDSARRTVDAALFRTMDRQRQLRAASSRGFAPLDLQRACSSSSSSLPPPASPRALERARTARARHAGAPRQRPDTASVPIVGTPPPLHSTTTTRPPSAGRPPSRTARSSGSRRAAAAVHSAGYSSGADGSPWQTRGASPAAASPPSGALPSSATKDARLASLADVGRHAAAHASERLARESSSRQREGTLSARGASTGYAPNFIQDLDATPAAQAGAPPATRPGTAAAACAAHEAAEGNALAAKGCGFGALRRLVCRWRSRRVGSRRAKIHLGGAAQNHAPSRGSPQPASPQRAPPHSASNSPASKTSPARLLRRLGSSGRGAVGALGRDSPPRRTSSGLGDAASARPSFSLGGFASSRALAVELTPAQRAVAEAFAEFASAKQAEAVLSTFHAMLQQLDVAAPRDRGGSAGGADGGGGSGSGEPQSWTSLRHPSRALLSDLNTELAPLLPHRSKLLLQALVARAQRAQYESAAADGALRCVVVGAGPIGLRCAIELSLCGLSVEILEGRRGFTRLQVS